MPSAGFAQKLLAYVEVIPATVIMALTLFCQQHSWPNTSFPSSPACSRPPSSLTCFARIRQNIPRISEYDSVSCRSFIIVKICDAWSTLGQALFSPLCFFPHLPVHVMTANDIIVHQTGCWNCPRLDCNHSCGQRHAWLGSSWRQSRRARRSYSGATHRLFR